MTIPWSSSQDLQGSLSGTVFAGRYLNSSSAGALSAAGRTLVAGTGRLRVNFRWDGSFTHWIIGPQELDTRAICSYHSIATELLKDKPHSVHKLGESSAAYAYRHAEQKTGISSYASHRWSIRLLVFMCFFSFSGPTFFLTSQFLVVVWCGLQCQVIHAFVLGQWIIFLVLAGASNLRKESFTLKEAGCQSELNATLLSYVELSGCTGTVCRGRAKRGAFEGKAKRTGGTAGSLVT